jgi:hypothetical protein
MLYKYSSDMNHASGIFHMAISIISGSTKSRSRYEDGVLCVLPLAPLHLLQTHLRRLSKGSRLHQPWFHFRL